MHDYLLDRNNDGVDRIRRIYARECHTLSQLQHPNITVFVGVYYQPECNVPLLVMELLHTSLHNFLESILHIPLQVKLSFLLDVSTGLHYLHSRNIIHRDLTANNVLLTQNFEVAKISDMGNSRIVDLPPDRIAATFTDTPGTPVYMPPEAFGNRSKYGYPLDIFSFGHLCLFTSIQVFLVIHIVQNINCTLCDILFRNFQENCLILLTQMRMVIYVLALKLTVAKLTWINLGGNLVLIKQLLI